MGLVDVGLRRQEGNTAVGREWGVVSDVSPPAMGHLSVASV
jgi:hypothetical protein